MNQTSSYFILDPSVFVSIRKMKEVFRILHSLSQPKIDSTTEISVVVPTELYNVLHSIVKGEKAPSHIKILNEVFSRWLPFYDKYHVELIVKQLLVDVRYKDLVSRFFESFKPVSGREYVQDQNEIGEKTLHLDDIVNELGEIVGRLVFELLALSHKLKGMIISFSKRLANLIRKLKITVVTVHSEYKKEVKRHARIRSLLRISLYAMTTESLHKLIRDFQVSGLDLNLAVDIAGLGVFIVADG